MRYVSDQLYHFVGFRHPADDQRNYEVLRKILATECISCPPHIPGWGHVRVTINRGARLLDGELLVPDVVCFADIPLECLSIHRRKYGSFGLGLDRQYLARYGARPVMYVPFGPDDWMSIYGTTLIADVEAVYLSLRNHLKSKSTTQQRHLTQQPPTLDQAAQAAKHVFETGFLAFLKPFRADLPMHDPQNFYMEREWRRMGNVVVDSESLSSILVPADYVSRARSDFPQFAHAVRDVDGNTQR